MFLHISDMKLSNFNYGGYLVSKVYLHDNTTIVTRSFPLGNLNAALLLLLCYEHILTDTGINLDKIMNICYRLHNLLANTVYVSHVQVFTVLYCPVVIAYFL